MKTIRNSVFETNSSSMHSFCISNDTPAITQFNDLHMKIDASGEYGWGPGTVDTPEEKLDHAIVAMLILCEDRTEDVESDENQKCVIRFAKGEKLKKQVKTYYDNIIDTFAKHGVLVEFDEKLYEIDPDACWCIRLNHSGYIDHQSDPRDNSDCYQIAKWAMKDPESLFNYCFNSSHIELDNDNH